MFAVCFRSGLCSMKTCWFANVGHLKRATYNCPCKSAGCVRYIPRCWIVWPCDLLIIIANAGCTGNWWQESTKGRWDFITFKDIRGMKNLSPTLEPFNILPSMRLWHCKYLDPDWDCVRLLLAFQLSMFEQMVAFCLEIMCLKIQLAR